MFKLLSVPVKVRVLLLPATVIPVPAAAVRLPPVLVVKVSVRSPAAASTSLRFMADRSMLLATSSVTATSVGRLPALLGSSLTAAMFNVTSSESVFVPPLPLLPWSEVRTVNVSDPLAFAAVV